MQNSKLVTILKTLSLKELKQFKIYSHSPFFNNQEALKGLVTIVLDEAPAFNSEALGKRKVFSKLYPEKAYSESRMLNLISDVYQLLIDYLAYTDYKENTIIERLHLLATLRKKNLSKSFLSHLEEL